MNQTNTMQFCGVVLAMVAGLCACSESASPDEYQVSNEAPGGKADLFDGQFPAARDLALVVPMEEAKIEALEVLPSRWLSAVVDGLAKSELAENIDEESWPEDWRLVSGRFTVCSPLGKRVDAMEIDRLCWPEIRLVWQPIVENANVSGRVRPTYGDDRAIHSLYFVEHGDPELAKIRRHLAEGGTLADLSADELAGFDGARDRAGKKLLTALSALRAGSGPYDGIASRPEYFDESTSRTFTVTLQAMLKEMCPPEGLHELTAFSLPMGRNPAAADLWSFIAFAGRNGQLVPVPLAVHDAETGEELFAFEHSEDVTTGATDPELMDALDSLDPESRARLESQVIIDTAELSRKAERINDPYQTLVPTTTCTSCHRSNNINFNFHNLSYLEDQEISVAPRVFNDVARDLSNARRLWRR